MDRAFGRDLSGRHVDADGVQPVVQRVDEAACADLRQEGSRRRADDLRSALDALEPVEQAELFVGSERAGIVQHQRAAFLGRRQREPFARAPPHDRFVQIEQQRFEDEPHDAIRRDEEEIHTRHPHQQEIHVRRPRQPPVIGQRATARRRHTSVWDSVRNLR